MAYTKELIEEVRELYPDSPKMHELAESGHPILGRYLDDSSSGGISIDQILLATTLEELQTKARLLKRKVNLYKKWCEQDPRNRMKNEHILPGQIVPENIRLEVYKEALQHVKNEIPKSRIAGFGLCLLLPCVLWDLYYYCDEAPCGETWAYYDTEKTFPEMKGIIQAVGKTKTDEDLKRTRIQFLTAAIEKLEKQTSLKTL